jgi:hypothetical protein
MNPTPKPQTVNVIMQITIFALYKIGENIQPIFLIGHNNKSIIKENAIHATYFYSINVVNVGAVSAHAVSFSIIFPSLDGRG